MTVSDVRARNLPAQDLLSMVVKCILDTSAIKEMRDSIGCSATVVLVVPSTWSRNATECLINATVKVKVHIY